MLLGYAEAALADAEQAVKDAREIGHAASLMYALAYADLTQMLCGNYVAEGRRELAALADEKGSLFWKTVALSIEAGIWLSLVTRQKHFLCLPLREMLSAQPEQIT